VSPICPEIWLRQTLDEARRGTLAGMVQTGAPFADAAAEYLRYIEHDRGREPATIQGYHSSIDAHLLPAIRRDGESVAAASRETGDPRIPTGRTMCGRWRVATRRVDLALVCETRIQWVSSAMRATTRTAFVAGAIATAFVVTAGPAIGSGAVGVVGTPVATYHHDKDGISFEVVAKLTKPALRQSNGSPEAGALIDGWGPTFDFGINTDSVGGFSSFGKPAQLCYLQSTIDLIGKPPAGLQHPTSGQTASVRVVLDGQPSVTKTEHLLAGNSSKVNAALRDLGCRPSASR
jgi:hypothetical protein